MKNKIIFLLLLSAGNLFSQLSVGIIGGPNRAYLWGPDFTQTNEAYNYVTGFSTEYTFSDHYSIIAMPRFDVKGNSFVLGLTDEAGNLTGEITLKNKLNYLMLPVMFGIKLGRRIKFVANTGLYASYLVSANRTINPVHPLFPKESIKDDFKKLDAGATLMIGVEFPIGKQLHLSVLISNDIGLVDISDFAASPGPIMNNSTSALIGFGYTFGNSGTRN